jgi:hypothetical protein
LVDQIVAGVITAITAALLAVAVAKWYTARRERELRDETATQEFYRAYGAFFGAWKAWDDVSGRATLESGDHAQYLTRVAEAEGMLESFLLRLTLDRTVGTTDLHRLWCFRRGYKEVWYCVRRRECVPWRRTKPPEGESDIGYRKYTAFKQLTAAVAGMIAERPRPHRSWRWHRWRWLLRAKPHSTRHSARQHLENEGPEATGREEREGPHTGERHVAGNGRPPSALAVNNLAVVTGEKDVIWEHYKTDLCKRYADELREVYHRKLAERRTQNEKCKKPRPDPQPSDPPSSSVLWYLVAEHLAETGEPTLPSALRR